MRSGGYPTGHSVCLKPSFYSSRGKMHRSRNQKCSLSFPVISSKFFPLVPTTQGNCVSYQPDCELLGFRCLSAQGKHASTKKHNHIMMNSEAVLWPFQNSPASVSTDRRRSLYWLGWLIPLTGRKLDGCYLMETWRTMFEMQRSTRAPLGTLLPNNPGRKEIFATQDKHVRI